MARTNGLAIARGRRCAEGPLDRSGLAWEFLRRNPDFREHYASILERIESDRPFRRSGGSGAFCRWGCLVLRHPSLPASSGPMVWGPRPSRPWRDFVAAPDRHSEAHELSGRMSTTPARSRRADGAARSCIHDPESDHSCGSRTCRIGDRLAGLVVLDDNFALRIAALQRLHLAFLLRAAPPTGASPVVIAGVLRSCSERSTAISTRPAIARSPMRSSGRRRSLAMPGRHRRSAARPSGLVKDALRMMNGGYRQLLTGD